MKSKRKLGVKKIWIYIYISPVSGGVEDNPDNPYLGQHNISTQPGSVVFTNIKHYDDAQSELCVEIDNLHLLGKMLTSFPFAGGICDKFMFQNCSKTEASSAIFCCRFGGGVGVIPSR